MSFCQPPPPRFFHPAHFFYVCVPTETKRISALDETFQSRKQDLRCAYEWLIPPKARGAIFLLSAPPLRIHLPLFMLEYHTMLQYGHGRVL